jgi:decaprenyl-phosphate phosphoribosyltransferase
MNIASYLKIFRLHQWLKNLLLFFPPFLGGTIFSCCLTLNVLIPFVSFCFISSSTYILNDIFDRDSDLNHPEKCKRPITSGRISVPTAYLFAFVLVCCSMYLAWYVSTIFLSIVAVYFLISLAYTMKIKEMVLADIFCISAGFLLRLQAGGFAYNVTVSEWLFLSVFLLSVFLSSGKRLAEKKRLGETAYYHRKALVAYPEGFLEGVMHTTGSAVLVTYTMYVISRHSALLLYTVPLCCFGLLRYMFRVQSGKGGDPTESLLKDVPLLTIGIVWVLMVSWGIYG